MPNLNTMTGNRAILKIGGVAVAIGFIQNVNVNDDFGLQDVDGLGEEESVELVTGKVSHSISMSKLFPYNKKLTDLGYVPEKANYLIGNEFEIEILDKLGQKTLELYTGAKVASYGRSYGKHAVCMEDVQFRAIHKEV